MTKNLQVLTHKNKKLFAGTKQECMNFIKENKLNRADIKIEVFCSKPEDFELNLKTTVPNETITQTTTASWYKRVFKK